MNILISIDVWRQTENQSIAYFEGVNKGYISNSYRCLFFNGFKNVRVYEILAFITIQSIIHECHLRHSISVDSK